ncbi:MAG: NAD(P)-dependent oxidoreductase [Erysipelotrichaceae bacterium]|nr:NAD(P)-dependent oxidoreductase [Erysipelotrichaceae bacterium]
MEHIQNDAKRCLKCKNARCQNGCPIHTPIPEINKLIESEQYEDAAYMLFNNNPMSMVCSLICNHEKQCRGNCVLGIKGSPVDFPAIEHYVSNSFFERIKIEKEPDNGKKVAIIGAGPSGISIAILLTKKGYQVTIFEGKDKIGGVLQYGIPDFRLPKSILERYRKKLIDIGVQIRPNVTIGETLTIDDLLNDGYKSVFVGTGVWKPNKLGIKGESLGHVHYAIDYLANPEVFNLGRKVSVIGMGNSAMDVARTALRYGAEEVYMFARGDKSKANTDEIMAAKMDGAKLVFYHSPKEITEKGILFDVTDGSGTEDFHECDSVIISVSQGPRNRLVTTTEGLDPNEKGLLVTEENGATSRAGVFAAGDVVMGAKTAVDAVNNAKIVAKAMHEYMMNLE